MKWLKKIFSSHKNETDTEPPEDLLTGFDLLQSLSTESRRIFEELSYRRTFKAGEYVFKQGYPNVVMYLLVSGRVELVLEDKSQDPIVLNTLNAPSHFGEVGLFIDSQRTASARCLEDTVLHAVSKDDFKGFIRSHPDIGIKLLWAFYTNLAKVLQKYSVQQAELCLVLHHKRTGVLQQLLNGTEQILPAWTSSDLEELAVCYGAKQEIHAIFKSQGKLQDMTPAQLYRFVNTNYKKGVKLLYSFCQGLSNQMVAVNKGLYNERP